MPSAQPTCAARIIRNNFLQPGWGSTLSKEANEVVQSLKYEAGAMYQMQNFRNRPISSASMSSALFWEHRHLVQQRIVSTPAIDDELELELFSEEEPSQGGLSNIRRNTSKDSRHVMIHPLFEPMREREFAVWPIRVNGVWVTIILQAEHKSMAVQEPTGYFDREVTRFSIVDPLQTGRHSRAQFLHRRLPEVLAEGGISLQVAATPIPTNEIEDEWASGHVAYAVSREFLRRLRVLLYRRRCGPASTDFVFGPFEEHLDIDYYRESITSACAHHAIEKSKYHIRLALEVPSDKSKYNPDALSHVRVDPEDVPNELYTQKHHTIRDVIVQVAEHLLDAKPEIVREEQPELQSESEWSVADEEMRSPTQETRMPGTEDLDMGDADTFTAINGNEVVLEAQETSDERAVQVHEEHEDSSHIDDTNLPDEVRRLSTAEQSQPIVEEDDHEGKLPLKRRLSDAEALPEKRPKVEDQ